MVGTLPETTVVHHTGEKGPITLTTCGLRTGSCGDGLVAVVHSSVQPSKADSIMFGLCTLADIWVFHLFSRHLLAYRGNCRVDPRVYKVQMVLKPNADISGTFQDVKLKTGQTNIVLLK